MKLFLLSLSVFVSTHALALVDAEVSRSGGAESYSNNLSLGYLLNSFVDQDTSSVGLSQSFNYSYTGSQYITSLNSNFSDFTIDSATHQLAYEVTLLEALTLNASLLNTKFNKGEAYQNQISGGLFYQVGPLRAGVSTAYTKTFQDADVIVLNQNLRDDIKITQHSQSYYLAYRWTENLLTSLSYTYYSYDENLNNLYTVLTTAVLLNRTKGAVASEVSSQPKNNFQVNASYSVNENWFLDLGLSITQDQLDPSAKTNSYSLGVEYDLIDNDKLYRIFTHLYSARSSDTTDNSGSALVGLGVSF